MREFTEADLIAPIFVEPPDSIGRPDGWSSPHGFLLGGMGDPSRAEIGRQYIDAANQLVEDILAKRIEDYTIALPVLFLYRHAIEVVLKDAMCGGKGHQLDELALGFKSYILNKHGVQVPDWITDRLREIAEIDPRSTSFRYAVKRSCKGGDEPLGGEHYIDLLRLRGTMNLLFDTLERVIKKGS